MLVLSRHINETLIIGKDIRVTVLRFIQSANRPPRVTLGIEAPRDCPVDRAEIREAKEADHAARGKD